MAVNGGIILSVFACAVTVFGVADNGGASAAGGYGTAHYNAISCGIGKYISLVIGA